ncbi:hypothetical protein FRC00_013740 [Tulasnella sp. 408]|nr:hypothetical protein FRC00_013740 [Tulasnella sp. 408]
MNDPQFEPRLTAIPDVPKEFGEDGGQFYKYYDALADELDDDMVKTLKSQVDSILIFAGLFAGVNSAFLALTLPELRADPADDTNALLLQLVTGGNSTIRSADDLPSATFTPSPGIIPVNILFTLSLWLAIIASFFSVLGRQWLIRYRKRSDGGTENQRLEQLRRYLGVRQWHLEWVLDDLLPASLQLALLIFSIALVIYVQTLSKMVCLVEATVIGITVNIVFLLELIAIKDKWCPFNSTLSRLMRFIFQNPIRYWPLVPIPFLAGYAIWLPLAIAFGVPASIIASCMTLKQKLGIYFGNSPLTMQADDLTATRLRQTLWSYVELAPRLGKGSVPPGKPPAFLKAVAVRRVLRTSGDIKTLIQTAINIQAMNSREGAQYLLEDDTVHERLEELIRSSDELLAPAFTCAFSHLFLGGQSAELFVKEEHRGLYSSSNLLSQTYRYCDTPHPLQERVLFICHRLKAIAQSPGIRPDTFVESLHYFELLELILDEKSNNQELSKWLDRVVQKQQPAKASTPLVISLVADACRVLNRGIESAEASSGIQISRSGPDPERLGQEKLGQDTDPERFFNVQRQRIEIVKEVIGTVGWELKLVPSYPSESRRKSALGLIEEAFCPDNSHSSRQPDKTDVWLLEQALLISTSKRHEPGWEFVATSSVALLLLFNNPEYSSPDTIGTPDGVKDNRLRCAKILSQCIRATRDHLGPDEFIQTISPALDKLVFYWTEFKNDFSQNPDLHDSDMLSTWLEIRGALDRSEESGWGFLHHQQFGQAYPSLKIGFDAIASAMSVIASQVNRDLPVLPPVAPFNEQAGRKELDDAAPSGATTKSYDSFDNPLEDARGRREHEDSRKPEWGERRQRPGELARDANQKPADEDE